MLSRSITLLVPACFVGVAALPSIPSAAEQAPPGQVRFELAPAGNVARYRVREQFLDISFPSDAIGTTTAITGAIVLDAKGAIVPKESRFVVDIRTLKSDSENRDRIIHDRTLHTAKFPNVEIVVSELRGLKYPFPPTGEFTFELIGDLSIHGVTKPWTWQVTATSKAGGLAGRASTAFKFGDFGMTVPTSFRLLSVEDNVRLEYDFHLVPAR